MKRAQIRMLDMFCGGGGSSRGAVMAGASPAAALDMWKLATDGYRLNFPESKVYPVKASKLLPTQIIKDVGKIDLIIASPECTSHSVAKGNKPRCDRSKETAFEVIRFAKVLKPRWIVVENVIQMQKWYRFSEWYEKMNDLGYQTKIAIFNAQNFDTPQSRRRLFIIGDLERIPVLPTPTGPTKKTVACSILGCGESKNEPWPFSPVNSPRRAKATLNRAKFAIKEIGAGTAFIMVYYSTDGAGGFQTLNRPLRTVTTLDRFAYVRPNCNGYEMRMLQPPELAAAMGFPSYHIWPESSRRDRIKLIGNAVCPPVMQSIISALTEGQE
ncbi:DNA cytosine methyltransferase [bacterium]|nr:DNA cytosine methyltransferase [bacterium]